MPDLLPSKIQLNEFVLDTVQQTLMQPEGDFTLEPKVYEVLRYLLAHRERYVSLQELHDNVWTGRVVTDTAVRRTISKLRAVLQDTDADNPRFIRSQMKRGYQLICEVIVLAEQPALATDVAIMPADNIPLGLTAVNNLSHNPSNEREAPDSAVRYTKRLKLSAALLVSCVFFAVLYWQLFVTADKPVATLTLTEQQQLLNLPGQKASLAVSQDGRLLAFVAKVSRDSPWQLYLYDTISTRLQNIATPSEHTRFVSFIANDTQLAYVGFSGNQASLYTQALDNLAEPPRFHPTAPFEILGDIVDLGNHRILINAGISATDNKNNIHYYQYDLQTQQFEQFSFSSDISIQDVGAVISPDKTLLALARANIYKETVAFQLYRLADKELVAEYPLQNNLQHGSFNWLDQHSLLLVSGSNHYLLNALTGERSAVQVTSQPLHQFHFTRSGELIALNAQHLPRVIYQAPWPYQQQFSKSYQLGSDARELSFSAEDGGLYLITRESQRSVLYRYDSRSGDRQRLLDAAERLSVADYTADGRLVLLKRGNRLELLDTQTAQVTAVTVSTQQAGTGHFNLAGDAVYFSERVNEQWQVKRYTLADKTQQVLLTDYRYLQQYGEGYIALASSGTLWLLDSDFKPSQQLYANMSMLDDMFQVELRKDKLILAYPNLMGYWYLKELNLTTMQQWQRTLPVDDFGIPFFIDHAGQHILFNTYPGIENQVVRYVYQ